MRQYRLFVLVTLSLIGANTYAGYEEDIAAIQKNMPISVKKVIERQVACNHWAGEEPYDAERAKEIEKAVNQLKCSTLEQDEAKLIKKYKARADVKEAINQAKAYF
jgi:hypothetical protein